MIKSFLRQILRKTNYTELIQKINALEDNIKLLTDHELAEKTIKFKKILKEKNDLSSIITDAFALVRETSRRKLGLRHYDVQLIGGLVLNDGKIAEMQTGEGKTIVATLPAYLNALTEKSVQIVTVNDYLAKRDYNSTREVYDTLGLNIGVIQESFSEYERQKNYNTNITYVTNSELGFDYLRDNLTFSNKNVRLPKFNFCIIDEIDSILIDESQTPLIMSTSIETSVTKYLVAAQIVKYLQVNKDFQIDEKKQIVILTDQGIAIIKKILKINNLYDINDPWIPYILNAIKARSLFFQNVNYIIENNQVIIVDEFTGRVSPDRKWSEGLHQAIQAKEKLFVEPTTQTIASITYQNLFLLYPKLAGMTGTAKTSEVEFDKIFKLSVEKIPPAKPSRRIDLPDLIYRDEFTKWRAVVNQAKLILSNKQPILIGTKTIEQSEMLSYLLNEYKLYHEILNARPQNAKNEADIVALAGEIGRITIATNMSGRGTDIILGGNVEYKISNKLADIIFLYYDIKFTKSKLNLLYLLFNNKILKNTSLKFLISFISFLVDEKFNEFLDHSNVETSSLYIDLLLNKLEYSEKKIYRLQNNFIRSKGGLFVIGTERNDSRRIDNQLRGRCGRQGEPGTSQFFLSSDDKLLRLFGGQNIKNSLPTNEMPMQSELLNKVLDSAQNQLEEISFGFRKNLVEYDEAVNSQRNTIYSDRKEILGNQRLTNTLILTYGEQIICEFLNYLKSKKTYINYFDTKIEIDNFFGNTLLTDLAETTYEEKTISKHLVFKYLTNYLFEELWLIYESKKIEREVGFKNVLNLLERDAILWYLDLVWQDHLHLLTLYRDAVNWRSYGQRNPLFEYKRDIYFLYIYQLQTFRQIVVFSFIRSYSI